MVKRVDHIGIVVKDLEKAVEVYSKGFGLRPIEQRELKDVPLKAAVFRMGETMVELLEYGKPDQEPAKTLRGDQEGLNHVCYEVEELNESTKRLQEAGFQLVPGFPRTGVRGRIAFFIPPSPCKELVEILSMDEA